MMTILIKMRDAVTGRSRRARNAEETALRLAIVEQGAEHAAAVQQIRSAADYIAGIMREAAARPLPEPPRRRRGPRSSGRPQLA